MRKFGFLLFIPFLLNSCGKSQDSGCQPVPVANEKPEMEAYCFANSINYKEDPSGLFYEVINPGTGASPSLMSTISVTYTGELESGGIFATVNTPVDYPLAGAIDGWRIGLPLLKKGGHIKLVVPSALAYSCSGSGTAIPPNSILVYDVTLVDIK